MNLEFWRFSYKSHDVYPFFYDCNWITPVTCAPFFETVLAQSKRHIEQRRPLRQNILREQTVSINVIREQQQRFVNDLKLLQSKYLLVPCYCEPIYPTNDLINAVEIYTDEYIENYWYLENVTDSLLAIDEDSGEYEVLFLSSVFPDKISLVFAITAFLNKDTTVIYPGFYGILTKIRNIIETDTMIIANLQFNEVVIEEPPSDWGNGSGPPPS